MLAEYTLTPEEAAAQQHKSVIVAVRDSHLMATAFHPELTQVRSWAQAHKLSFPARCAVLTAMRRERAAGRQLLGSGRAEWSRLCTYLLSRFAHGQPAAQDTRWHELFVEMVKQHAADVAAAAAAAPAPDPFAKLGRPPNRPADLPVY